MGEGEVLTPRAYPRYPSTTAVRVQVAHVWEGASRRDLSGILRDVSRGGAGVLLPLVLPPRTVLTVDFPEIPGVRLPAEIVWTSKAPGSVPAFSVAGLRWMAHVPRYLFSTMIPGCGVPDSPEDPASPHA
jgi:hypothetical protein